MENISPEIAKLFTAKEDRRQKLAELSFPEKVTIVVQLQQMIAPILRSREKLVQIWKI